MSYDEVWTVIDGAVDEEWEIRFPHEYREILASVEAWVSGQDEDGEVTGCATVVDLFSIYHNHAPDLECECAQYCQDHRPIRSWGRVVS